MNEDEFKGTVGNVAGAAEKLTGRVTDNPGMELRGDAREAAGKMQAGAGKAQDAIGSVADKLSAGVAKVSGKATKAVGNLSDRASDAYDKAAATAQQVGATVEPFVQERPYAALGIAAGLGVVVGLLLAGRGTKVVYVRRQH